MTKPDFPIKTWAQYEALDPYTRAITLAWPGALIDIEAVKEDRRVGQHARSSEEIDGMVTDWLKSDEAYEATRTCVKAVADMLGDPIVRASRWQRFKNKVRKGNR